MSNAESGARVPTDEPVMPSAEDEYITVIGVRPDGSQPQQVRVLKSILVRESGFFRVMFSHAFQESKTRVVHLHEDNPIVVKWFFMALADQALPLDTAMMSFIVGQAAMLGPEKGLQIVLEVYSFADKYDIASLRRQLAFWCARTVEKLLRVSFTGVDESDHDPSIAQWTQDKFVKLYFNAVSEKFNGYPHDLSQAYAAAVAYYTRTQGNADVLIDAIEPYPKLATAIHKEFAKEYKAAKAETVKLKKTLELAKDKFVEGRELIPRTLSSETARIQEILQFTEAKFVEGAGIILDVIDTDREWYL